MAKEYILPQPPRTDKYQLLVDDLSEDGLIGTTKDNDKVEYNRSVLRDLVVEVDMKLQIHSALSQKGTNLVMPLGQYVCIIGTNRDESEQYMLFFHCSIFPIEFLKDSFSENIVNTYTEIRNELLAGRWKEFDLFKLISINN